MKKLLFVALLAVGLTANAEQRRNNGDSEDKKDSSIPTKIEKGPWSAHLSIGVDIPVSVPDGIDFAPFRSWDINWTVLQYNLLHKMENQDLFIGVGLNWRNYTLKHDEEHMFYKVNDVVGVGTGNFDDLSSRIHTMAISVPVLFKQKLGGDLAFSVGGQVNFNVIGELHNSYEDGDDDISVETGKIGQRPVTVDVIGILHIDDLGIYCKYSPMSVLKKDRGPEFQSLSVGLYF